jgi:hypothetical protein
LDRTSAAGEGLVMTSYSNMIGSPFLDCFKQLAFRLAASIRPWRGAG